MAAPGTPGNLAPSDDATQIRRVEDVERSVRELGPSIAKSFGPVILDLQEKQAALEAQQAAIIDLLANQVTQRSGYGNATAFGLTTTPTTFCSHTITVPTGYTDGAYFAAGSLGVYNTSGSPQYAYLRVYAQAAGYSAWGARQQVTIPNGYVATLSATLVREYDVALTPGDPVTFYVEAFASAAIPADAINYAFCEELVTFTR